MASAIAVFVLAASASVDAAGDDNVQSMADKVNRRVANVAATIAAKLPPAVSEKVQNHLTSASDAASAGLAQVVRSLLSYLALASEHTDRVFQSARAHVAPLVTPHLKALSDRVRDATAPALTAATDALAPWYRDLEADFGAATSGASSLTLALAAAAASLAVYTLLSYLLAPRSARVQATSTRGRNLLGYLPGVRGHIDRETAKASAELRKALAGRDGEEEPLTEIPDFGMDADNVMTELETRAMLDFRYADFESRTTGVIYMAGDAHRDLLNDAYCMFSQANPLHPDLFPSVRRMEAEVVAMTASLLGREANPQVCGAMTSGGTESIVSAVAASLAWQRRARGVRAPEIVISESAHAAYWKAARLCGARLVVVPVARSGFRLTAAAVRRCLTRNTALVVASAPSWPHGAVDEVEGLARAARSHGACLHVDACLGGFVLPFLRRLGHDVPPFDFALPGVTSMSVDTHKYGLAHKGTSVVLYASRELLHEQYTAVTDWSGGLYISPGLAGSRSGALVVTAWAAMRHIGVRGYTDIARGIAAGAAQLRDAVSALPELEVCGSPCGPVVAFRSIKPGFDIHVLNDFLEQRGWHVSVLAKPPALHFAFTAQHRNAAAELCADLEGAAAAVRERAETPPGGKARLYGMAASVADGGILGEILTDYQDALLSVRPGQAS